MRIIGGKLRGTKIYTLDGLETRPTMDRVREALFNIIALDINESTFLDLFAGSGAVGIEASSRGAKKVIMCDSAKRAMFLINKNLEKTRLQDEITVYNMDFENCIKEKLNEKIDIIFLDPPYKTDCAYRATKLLLNKKLIHKDTIIIIETDTEQIVEKQFKKLNLTEFKMRKYGRASLLFYKLKENDSK